MMSKQQAQSASGIGKPEDRLMQDDDPDASDVRDGITSQMGGHDDAADIALAAVDELADRATEIESLRQELESSQEQLLRNAAEFQNYRRRTEQEKAQLVGLGKTLVIQQFLDIVDDFQRSLEAAEQVDRNDSESGSAYRALKEGVDLVYRKFVDGLTKLGVQPIEAVGRPFDENEHEAMMQQPDTDAAPGTVIEELQKGYRMGDRILRHAKVIVAA
jgi:molecular chaperone GrpE